LGKDRGGESQKILGYCQGDSEVAKTEVAEQLYYKIEFLFKVKDRWYGEGNRLEQFGQSEEDVKIKQPKE
jgi:hypothetical protein